MPDRKPKVFISSTIYDFRDLRSALKFWLEELGYEVLLSDHSDFPVQVDRNSYDTCLNAIDGCDYFILLVGGRVGGWYDASNRISITQAEYRRAYEQLKAGRLKLLVFVRQDIWDVREDRKELEAFLKNDALHNAELGEADIALIAKHPSKFANDAEFTFGFLNEIARVEEMKAATKTAGPFPPGNWIRQFTNFKDIIDALRVEFRIGANLRRIALLANLKSEIESNFRVLADWSEAGNTIDPKYSWASSARDDFTGGINDSSDIEGDHLKWLGIFALFGCGIGRKLSVNALDEAITSGEMLDYDRMVDAYVVGPLQQALLDLKRNIERLRHDDELITTAARIELSLRFKDKAGDERTSIRNLELIPLFSIHDSQANIVNLSRAIYRAANGDLSQLGRGELCGDSPLDSENQIMKRERPSVAQIRKWLE